MGLFDPIWKTDKEEKIPKAIAAVQKEADPAKLETIATSAHFAKIRLAACDRISSKDTLAEIAKASDCDVACQLLDRLSGRDDLLMSVAECFANAYNARLLVPLLGKVEKPNLEKLINITCAIVDHRKRDGKFFRDIDGYERILESVGRAAYKAYGDKAKASALIEQCVAGWNYAMNSNNSAKASFETVIGWHSPVMRELETALPKDPKGQRNYINRYKKQADKDGELHFTRAREVLGCCLCIEALRPYAYDVYQVVHTDRLRCDLSGLEGKPDPLRDARARHERTCVRWKESAQKLISLAMNQPELIYPVRGQLAQAINGAKAQVRERKQVGYKTVHQRVAPDAPDDWTEARKVPDYAFSTKKTPMGLVFPPEN
ncbi:MAG: hypothetical protein IJH83_01885 [Coriobacteriales bacterium]|nr:hypothetical protein [Coriobacteriales bacterium]